MAAELFRSDHGRSDPLRPGAGQNVRDPSEIAPRPWPPAYVTQGVVVDLHEHNVAARVMAMELVARDAQPILSDFAEADQPKHKPGNGHPQKQLPWRRLGDRSLARRHQSALSFPIGVPRMRAKRLGKR